jgi:large subunit ribosomal protein L25
VEDFTIDVLPRQEKGSVASRRYRAEGYIPSIVYAHGKEGLPVLLPKKEFTHLARAAKSSQIFSLRSKASEINGKSALVKDLQLDQLRGDVIHVDLQEVSEFEEIEVEVNLKFMGEAPGVKLDGGILTVLKRSVTCVCLPKAIPQELTVDISELHIGDSLHVHNIPVPAGVKIADDPSETVVSVVTVHVVAEETPAAAVEGAAPVEGAVPAEGAAAAGAEGAAQPAAQTAVGAEKGAERTEKKGKDKG